MKYFIIFVLGLAANQVASCVGSELSDTYVIRPCQHLENPAYRKCTAETAKTPMGLLSQILGHNYFWKLFNPDSSSGYLPFSEESK